MWVEKTPKFTSKYTGRQSPLLDSFQKEDFGLVFDVGRENPQLPHPALRSLAQHVQNGSDLVHGESGGIKLDSLHHPEGPEKNLSGDGRQISGGEILRTEV